MKNKTISIGVMSQEKIREMIWVLKVKNCTRHQICESVLDLLDSPGIVVALREIIAAAVEKYAKGKADFGDYLILAEGEAYSVIKLASFDKKLCKDDKRSLHPPKFD